MLHRSWSADLTTTTLYALLRLRVDVFVVEQACPYPELDGRDLEPGTRHYWIAADDGTVASTLRVLEDPPTVDGEPMFRIGRVCTHRAHRGKHLSNRLMDAALADIGEHACRVEAQAYLTEMYAAHGFVAEGAEYLEDGIPHVSMLRPKVSAR